MRTTQRADLVEPPEPPPPSPASFGSMQISTVPPVKIFRGGAVTSQTFKLKSENGKLVFGTGKDPETDPFVVTIRYELQGGEITYTVRAEPWAIVRGNGGIGLGRTPLPPQKGGNKTVYELVNPKEKLTLRITLRYSR
ncbi:hypothetical protein ACFL6C_06945 [Myxococcota bacterium]